MNKSHNTKKYLQIFLTMLKIGAFTFGGGYAMISLLENEFVEKKKLIDKESFINMIAISESTPGPIAVNSATYIGYKVAGVVGSFVATLGVVVPSFVIIYIISLFFNQFLEFSYVAYAFKGIQVCVIYLILSAGVKLLKELKKTFFNITVLITVIALMVLFSVFAINFSSIFFIIICGVIGLVFYLVKTIKEKAGKQK